MSFSRSKTMELFRSKQCMREGWNLQEEEYSVLIREQKRNVQRKIQRWKRQQRKKRFRTANNHQAFSIRLPDTQCFRLYNLSWVSIKRVNNLYLLHIITRCEKLYNWKKRKRKKVNFKNACILSISTLQKVIFLTTLATKSTQEEVLFGRTCLAEPQNCCTFPSCHCGQDGSVMGKRWVKEIKEDARKRKGEKQTKIYPHKNTKQWFARLLIGSFDSVRTASLL